MCVCVISGSSEWMWQRSSKCAIAGKKIERCYQSEKTSDRKLSKNCLLYYCTRNLSWYLFDFLLVCCRSCCCRSRHRCRRRCSVVVVIVGRFPIFFLFFFSFEYTSSHFVSRIHSFDYSLGLSPCTCTAHVCIHFIYTHSHIPFLLCHLAIKSGYTNYIPNM